MGNIPEPLEFDPHIYDDIRETLAAARRKTCIAVNEAMVNAYWEIGRQIVEAQGERAEYGKRLLEYLAARLTREFGKGFDATNLRKMRQFYLAFEKRDALRLELSWTHYRLIMRLPTEKQRAFYMNEAADEQWSSRQLERQISTSYYERLLASRHDEKHCAIDRASASVSIPAVDNVFKDPYVSEFLDLKQDASVSENDLEHALIERLQDFMLELGKGFSFVARQQRISDDADHYYIDLVFYNYVLKCFVLIDLKTGKLSPQDVGQMDFYVRLYDDQRRLPGDNPTVGIILCAQKNDTVAKYSALADKNTLMASQYVTCLPSEEELAERLAYERKLLEAEQLKTIIEESEKDVL